MRKFIIALAVVIAALPAFAGKITSIEPSTITAGSAETFITISGKGLGDRVRFTGPAGTFERDISARNEDGSVVVFVPEPVVATAGTYEVVVLGGTGDTAPALLEVVEPEQPLVIFVPELVQAEATGPDGAVVTFTVTASGGQDPNPEITCNPSSGSVFPLGPSTVTCTATNSFGETATASFTVRVDDMTPPHVTAIATPDVLSPPNKKMVPVSIAVTATDAVDASPDCSIREVTSTQDITGDVNITGALTLELRAERSGGEDRVYQILVQCIDDSGNFGYGTVNVTVGK